MAFITIDIGPGRITAIQGSASGSTIDLTAVESTPIRQGLITDSIIKNKAELAAALTLLIGSNKAFSAKSAFVTLNQANAFVREFAVPDGSAKQIDAMVNNEMLNFNSAASSDVIEYKVLEKLTADNGSKSVRIRAFSVSRATVDTYYALLQDARLKPAVMDINPNAIDKLLARRPLINGVSQSESSFLLLDFSYPGVMAYIVYDYTVIASRFIPIGLADIDIGLNPGADENARPDLQKLINFNRDTAADPRIMRSAEDMVQQSCNEIQKLIMFSTGRIPRGAISSVFITGEGSTLPGIDKYLAAELSLFVAPLSSLSGLRFADKLSESRLPYIANALGALIRA